MMRVLILFVLVGVFVWLAVWFADNPGRVEIEVLGYRLATTVGVLAFVFAVSSALLAVSYRIWLAMRRAPSRFIESRGTSRRQRGYQALTHGMVAVAAGDAREAKRAAQKADSLLNEPPLTMLLSAQAAQLEGDEDAARKYFEAMLAEPDMAFLGVRGLLMQATRRDDKQEALRLADKAHQLRPDTPWVLKSLFDLQVGAGQWMAADKTLRDAIRVGIVDAATGRRRRAALAVEASREASSRDEKGIALKRAREAHDLDPGLAPASVAFANCLAESGKTRRAVKTLEGAWGRAPHPDVATAYGALGSETETPLNRVKRYQRLVTFNPDHPESHFALAEASLAAQLWGEARRHLDQIAADRRTARLFRLMADLEEQETGDLKAARQWLDQAANAPAENAWYCGECGSVADAWHACCENCDAFAALEWQLPPGVSVQASLPAPSKTAA